MSPDRESNNESSEDSKPYGSSPRKGAGGSASATQAGWTPEQDAIIIQKIRELVKEGLYAKVKDHPAFADKFASSKAPTSRVKERGEVLLKPLMKGLK